MSDPITGTLHHVEIWVPDLGRAVGSWGWLLEAMGYKVFQEFTGGRSYQLGATYIVLEQSPALTSGEHDRCAPGLNHLAFPVASTEAVDELVAAAPDHGWKLMYADRHPYAGGPDCYAAYLENDDGFEVELVGP
jgi:catechol 2,3-dioxygenase-like lactoylglutathione lyase family enzyme